MVSGTRIAYGALGAAATLAAAGATAGGMVLRARRRAGRTDPPEEFEELAVDRERTVQTEDGVGLYVAEVGPADASLTVVFTHGFSMSMRAYYYQERALRQKFGDTIRLVFYDHRGHGHSEPSVPAGSTVDQLGRDLYTVIDAVAPTRRLILVGHSMGGMTVLALAEQHPELFATTSARLRRSRGPRVAGVVLVCTTAGGLAEASWGLPSVVNRFRGPLAPVLLRGARKQAVLVEHSRRIGRDLAWVLTRRMSFGGDDISPEIVDFVNDMISATSIEAIADFYPALMAFDGTPGLATLGGTDVVVIGAERDVMIPAEHSQVIAEALPAAEYIEVPDVGHLVLLETPDAIDAPLVELVARSMTGKR